MSREKKREKELRDYLASRMTLWSFIKYRLNVHSPEHSKRVRRRLLKAIDALAREGRVVRVRSLRGKTSFALRA